jgi:hypothetical protein
MMTKNWEEVKMKKWNKFIKVCAMMVVLSMIAPVALPFSTATVAQAATVKLSDKKLTLEVGKSQTIKVMGTKQKITWTSSDKSVATVKNGKVIAKKAGTTTITAIVNKKKYTCKVTSLEGQKVTSGEVSYVIPKDWTSKVLTEQGESSLLLLYPASADVTKGASNINLSIIYTGTAKPDDETAKQYVEAKVTEDTINSQLKQSGMKDLISDFKTGMYQSKVGTVYTAEYKFELQGFAIKQNIYTAFFDNYYIQLNVNDFGDQAGSDIVTLGEYLIDSIKVNK